MESEIVDSMLRSVASFGLPEHRTPELGRLDREQWHLYLELSVAHRLTGLSNALVRSGAVELDETRRFDVERAHTAFSIRVLLLELAHTSIARDLHQHAIPVLALKGPALASLYPDPQFRPYVDVDVLVPGDRIHEAIAALSNLGYERQSPELCEGFDERFSKGTTLRKTEAATIDLHRTLIAGPYSFLIDPDSLFARPRSFQCAQDSLSTLNAEAQLVHCAVSAELADSQPKLIALRDLVQCLEDPALDIDQAVHLAQEWRISAVVGRAIGAADQALGTTCLERLDGRFAVRARSLRERVASWAYEAPARRWRRQAVVAIPFVPGWADRIEYTQSVLGTVARKSG